MKILVFTTLFPNSKMPNHGVFVKERIVNLAKLCDVRVVAPVPWHRFSRIPKEEIIEGLKVYHPRYFMTPKILRSLYGFFMFLSVIIFVKKLKEGFDFDLIDGHFIYPDGLAAVLLGSILRVKVCLTARGTDINWYPKFYIIRKLIKYTLKKADSIVSVSQSLKEAMVGLGTNENKIKFIPNGVNPDKFHYLPQNDSRKILGIPNDKKVLLSVGLLIERKGFHFLIDALRRLKRDDVILYIIGEGKWRERLINLTRRFAIEDKVRFLGEKPQDEISIWYSAADLFCLTSLREGRPNVVLEALACGTPVISMNKWGLPDLVTKEMGVLLEDYDIDKLVSTIEKALNIKWDRKHVSDSMKSFRWNRTAKDVYDLFVHAQKQRDIIFFSSDDWNSGLKTSKYHIATRLARQNRVFFINSLSLRTPSVSRQDIRKIFTKLNGFFKGPQEARKNIYVVTPILLPLQRLGIVRFFNNIIVSLQIKGLIRQFKTKRPQVWTFLPNSLGIIRRLPRQKLIYYCVDDMSTFMNVPEAAIKRLDEELTKESDVVFAVSKELFNEKKNLNSNTFYSPHGVDFELFNRAFMENTAEEPKDISNIPRPIIGFYGLMSSDWIDYGLVRYISKARPGWSFVFVGKIDTLKETPPESENIYYLPVKPYEDLYKYSRFFEVAILPFNINKLTMCSHPLKILEYLAAGKPVVSTNIPEAMKYENVIDIAQDHEDFLKRIEKCLKNNNKAMIDKRAQFAALNSWEKRFDEIQDIVHSHI